MTDPVKWLKTNGPLSDDTKEEEGMGLVNEEVRDQLDKIYTIGYKVVIKKSKMAL